ncbi:MAG: ABC transporter permease DevC [Xenococcaceae cyanobacterium MO_188.B19]|nr:ABC transporter permease DevC [Xenococcaceae cyanobacterium MO_188.B19]
MSDRLFTAWLQLKYQKIRFLIALSGVIFAVIIIFFQLGISNALFDGAVRFHQGLQGDCFILSSRSTNLTDLASFSQRRLSQAQAFEEVEYVNPIYFGVARWKNPESRNSWQSIGMIGFDLRHQTFDLPGIKSNINRLQARDTVLFDRNSRTEFGAVAEQFERDNSVITEVSNRRIKVVGLFELGTSFAFDGNILTSDLNFLRISNREKGFIDIGLIKLKTGADPENFKLKLQEYLPQDVQVFTKQEFINFEQNYWQTSQPIGFTFNLNVVMSFIVGAVVVYQILYTNVSEHLKEFATLKAIGYSHQYLLNIVFQQALIIGSLGYIPGLAIAIFIYKFAQQATLLPIAMTWQRAINILVATIIMCLIAGVSAVKKMKSANPADIF